MTGMKDFTVHLFIKISYVAKIQSDHFHDNHNNIDHNQDKLVVRSEIFVLRGEIKNDINV